jgi:hypothetical protein
MKQQKRGNLELAKERNMCGWKSKCYQLYKLLIMIVVARSAFFFYDSSQSLSNVYT